MTRSIRQLLALIMLFSVPIACARVESASQEQAVAAPPPPSFWSQAATPFRGLLLRGISENSPPSLYVRNVLAPAFERETGIQVDLQISNNTAIEEIIAAGGEAYDFVYIEQDMIYGYLAEARLVNITKLRLRQILINLLDNAFKFTTQGEISLYVQWLENGEHHGAALGETPTMDETEPKETGQSEESRATATMARLRFVVSDSGPGIAQDQIEKIFLPFEQLGDMQARAKGVGLGFAIAQELAHAMQARLTVQSVPNQGSQFVFAVDLLAVSQNEQPLVITQQREPPRPLSMNGEAHRLSPLLSTVSHDQPKPPSPHPPPVTLPTQELAILLDMAHKGELPRLRKRIEQIAAAQPQYQPFVQHMNQLIDSYDEEHILAMLQQEEIERSRLGD